MDDPRTTEQILEHYEVEKALANRLRNSTREERETLYADVYSELFLRLKHHPMLTQRDDGEETKETVHGKMRLLRRFLQSESTFLEVGAGDCSLALEVARHARKAFALDVSSLIDPNITPPPNFELILSNGFGLPFPDSSMDIVYSNQVIEHLHPDDALEQLDEIQRVLRPRGVYICLTPNRVSGPHDISRSFDAVATGLHLREYTNADLESLFQHAGFSDVKSCIGVRGRFAVTRTTPAIWLEKLISYLPRPIRQTVGEAFPFRCVLGIRLIAVK